MTERRIERFSFIERMMHWLAALSFLYAALTGLALWSHRLYWLAAVFGGGETVRGWHPWRNSIYFNYWLYVSELGKANEIR